MVSLKRHVVSRLILNTTGFFRFRFQKWVYRPVLQNVSIWCKQYFPQLLRGKENTYHSSWILMRRISNLTSKESSSWMSRLEWRTRLCENRVLVFTRSRRRGHHCKKGPGWNDPMTAVVPRVKGFACYDLSFSRHNKNIKMEHFFLCILSRYFIWLHKMKRVLMMSVHH